MPEKFRRIGITVEEFKELNGNPITGKLEEMRRNKDGLYYVISTESGKSIGIMETQALKVLRPYVVTRADLWLAMDDGSPFIGVKGIPGPLPSILRAKAEDSMDDV